MSETKNTLTEAEKKRLERFEKTAEEMKQQGYRRQDLTIDIGKANLFSVTLLIPLFIFGLGLYFIVNQRLDLPGIDIVFYMMSLILLIVVHVLVHGLTWSFFTPHGFRDIEFGVLRSSMTPYCACLVPLKKGPYIIGAAMPLIVLGIIPMIIAAFTANPSLMFAGILMADSAAGDIMIIDRIMKYKTDAKEIIYMDHPTEAGGVVFER